MLVTDNQEWAERAHYLTTQAKDDPVEYIHNEIGYNYHLTNLLAAMGVAQLEQIEEFIESKRAIARTYEEGLGDFEPVTLMPTQPGTEPTYWLYTILLGPQTGVEDRKAVIKSLNEYGIGSRPLWHPIHQLRPYRDCQAPWMEHSIRLYERCASLPSSVGLEAQDQQRCIAALREIVS